jgi:hypothetical protein
LPQLQFEIIRNVCRILFGKLEGQKPPGRLRRGWEDNIQMNLIEIECADLEFMAQDMDLWPAICELSGSMKDREYLD